MNRPETASKITEHQVELDVPIVYRSTIHARDAQKSDVQRVLVGADFGHARQVVGEGQSKQLRYFGGGKHELEYTVNGSVPPRLAVFAQDAQDDRQAFMDRKQRRKPGFQVVLPRYRIQMQPVVKRRKIEFRHASRQGGALLDRHEPLVVAKVHADFAALRQQPRTYLVDVIEQRVERFVLDGGVILERREQLALTLELLQDVGLEIGSRRHVGDLEQREQRGVVIRGCRRRVEEQSVTIQILEPHHGSYALVQRVFVADHVRVGAKGLRHSAPSAVPGDFTAASRLTLRGDGPPRALCTADRARRLAAQWHRAARCCRERRPRPEAGQRDRAGSP